MKIQVLLVLFLIFGHIGHAEKSVKNWLFDFYSEGIEAQGVVKSPEAKEIGSFSYLALGEYESNGESYRLTIEQSQIGQYGSSKHKKEWIWERDAGGGFKGHLVSEKPQKEKETAILKLHGENTFTLESYIGERLWTIQTGILERQTLIDSTVIYTRGMEYDFILASAIATKRKVDIEWVTPIGTPPLTPPAVRVRSQTDRDAAQSVLRRLYAGT